MERDIPAEALAWRESVRHPILATQIANLDAETLTGAYLTWWQTYTRCIRNASSNRNRMGVSSTDAAEAGETANRAVREFLTAHAAFKEANKAGVNDVPHRVLPDQPEPLRS